MKIKQARKINDNLSLRSVNICIHKKYIARNYY